MSAPPNPENEIYRLSVLRDMRILDTAAEERFDRITRLVCKILDVPIAAISLVDEKRQWFKSIQGLDVSETSREVSFCAHAIADGKPLHVSNTDLDPRFSENPLVTNDPHIKSYHGVPLKVDGAYVGALCGIDTRPHDVNEDQKQVLIDLGAILERELVAMDTEHGEQLEKQLQITQDFQDLIFENIPDYLFVKNEKFEIVRANNHFIGLYPKEKRDEVIGFTTVEEYPAEEATAFLEQDKIAFREGTSQVEETISFPSGGQRTLLTKKVRFEDADGDKYLLGLARDITHLKQIESELKEANSELEEFAYRTSHDLRSPLISSLGLAELTKQSIDKGDLKSAGASTDYVIVAMNRLLLLIDDLLQLTQAKNQQEDCSEFSFQALIDETLEKLAHMENFDRIDVHTDCSISDPVTYKLSRVRLIIENLISNSIKYQDPAEDRPFIKIKAARKDEFIIFEVEDNGLGIPEQYQEKLFGMFNRFHTRVSYGSGLGLYMVKKSADILDGSVEYEPRDQGSVFRLILPVN